MPVEPATTPQPGEPPRGELSPVVTDVVRVTHNIRVPMRDGVELALDIVRPDIPGPLPVVLTRTPYDKTLRRDSPLSVQLAKRGYVSAFVDCRGRYNSDGVFRPFFDEANDGFDTVEWIAAQEWCDGNVGMMGLSYAGQTPWFAASACPPHLKAIVPFCSPPGNLWRNEPIFGGCFFLPTSEWMHGLGTRTRQVFDPAFTQQYSSHQPYFETLPLAAIPDVAGVRSAWWDSFMEHPVFDDFWQQGSYDNYADINVAALNITGWWDMNFPGAPLNYEGLRDGKAAGKQKLIIGPWPHGVNQERRLNGVDFGENAVIEMFDYVIRFFDRWLKNVPNRIEDEKPVHVFVLGANEWWAEEDWPLPGTEQVPFYFHSGGQANSLSGDGRLSIESPDAEPSDTYCYDPTHAERIPWDVRDGPVDDRQFTTRDDCLCYTSDPLTEPLDVVGWVTCRLHASSSARDTDWHVRLVDVHPNGSARFLCHGALRARFRNSFAEPELLSPGEPTLFEFTMDACGIRFLPGHRIRVEVASSWFTKYDRNTNSGAENFFTDANVRPARQRVFHEAGLESSVVLPVIRRTTAPRKEPR